MSGPTDTTPTSNLRLLPGEGEGHLRTAQGDRLPIRAFKRGREVVLVVMVDVDEVQPSQTIPAAEVEYNSLRGVVRLHGQAVFEDHSVVRFEAHGEPEVMQRRSFVRVHTPQAVTLRAIDGAKQSVHTIDLSGGGMLITGAENLDAEEPVRFAMALGDGQPDVAGVARVVRITNGDRCALVFEQIDEGDRQRLIRFVFDLMRNARARTRGDFL
jgi:hypothetical protein